LGLAEKGLSIATIYKGGDILTDKSQKRRVVIPATRGN